MNNSVIYGRLARDPELKSYTNKNGDGKIVNFTVAVNRRFGDEADFFNCVAFGKAAEAIATHFHKGKEIICEGSMQCDPYDNKEGKKVYPWKLNVRAFYFCGKKEDRPATSSANSDQSFTPVDPEDLPF